MQKTKNALSGFDLTSIDRTVRPQDDFYHFANGGWLKKNKIPETESRWGSFTILRVEAEHNLKKIVDSLLAHKSPKKGSAEQLVGDLYCSGTDMKRRNALGIQPISSLRQKVHHISSQKELLRTIAYFHRLGHFYQSGLSLPDRDYYLKDSPEFLRVRTAYIKHLNTIFCLLGYTASEADKKTKIVLKIETRLAQISMDKVDTRDAEKTYNKKSIAELVKHVPAVNWQNYFKEAGIPRVPYVILMQPEFLKKAASLLQTLPLEDWKVYLEWHLIDDASGFLTDAFVKANFRFSQALTGNKKMKPLWRRILAVTNGALGEPLGKIYVKKYFDQAKKQKMDTLVSDLFAVYEARIKNLDWMSTSTKRKAITKLRLMNRKIGYPRKWKSYVGLVIRADDYFGNLLRATEFERKRQMKKLKSKSVDREEWHMYPQTVNAYCNFNLNEIVFPAAILQPPFFNFSADDAFNYGGIGAVIGHEMTHGFDDQGAKFDGKGNMKTWWSPSDKKKFEQKGKILVTQYNAFKVADNVAVNGQLTLGENIADLGGLVIGFDAYQRHLQKTGRKTIAGFTPEQRFFLGFAQAERELSRSEIIKTLTLTDPHSPAETRINGPLAHFTPFYEAFCVTKKNKLYRDLKNRAHIW
ncbi:MAG: putative metalloendopeptidase [Parcubacteria group bacterium Gr01-1014_56]|nr:MAG: putative metalloendopeptidase [Parcubacteria group bacterium Gr01-1014_56]